jgi:hypothetical protein
MGTVYRPQSRHPARGAGKRYLLASDFDQTLSFNDSGIVLSEMLGISGFGERCAGWKNVPALVWDGIAHATPRQASAW